MKAYVRRRWSSPCLLEYSGSGVRSEASRAVPPQVHHAPPAPSATPTPAHTLLKSRTDQTAYVNLSTCKSFYHTHKQSGTEGAHMRQQTFKHALERAIDSRLAIAVAAGGAA